MDQGTWGHHATIGTAMAALTFETREVLLTLAQQAHAEDTAVITIKLRLSSSPAVYVSGGKLLAQASWNMVVRALPPGAGAPGELGMMSYGGADGTSECLIVIDQAPARFHTIVEMFRGGHVSEITVVTDGMTLQDDYSSQWDTEAQPRLAVVQVSFEFPLPQSEA